MSAYVSTKNLHYQKVPRSFFGLISDLPDARIPLRQVYNDACDEGFDLVSHKTGNTITVRLEETVRRDGDILCWRFVPIDKKAPITGVVICND